MEEPLSRTEFIQAVQVGVQRRINAIYALRKPRYGWGESLSEWDADIEGACAEMLVARELGLPWDAKVDCPDNGSDVGGIGVRSTRYDNGHLIIQEGDHNARPFVLVVGKAPKIRIVGWLYAGDAKQAIYFEDSFRPDHPSFWVPQAELRPIEELKSILKGGERETTNPVL